jgi:hypothetical protein
MNTEIEKRLRSRVELLKTGNCMLQEKTKCLVKEKDSVCFGSLPQYLLVLYREYHKHGFYKPTGTNWDFNEQGNSSDYKCSMAVGASTKIIARAFFQCAARMVQKMV